MGIFPRLSTATAGFHNLLILLMPIKHTVATRSSIGVRLTVLCGGLKNENRVVGTGFLLLMVVALGFWQQY